MMIIIEMILNGMIEQVTFVLNSILLVSPNCKTSCKAPPPVFIHSISHSAPFNPDIFFYHQIYLFPWLHRQNLHLFQPSTPSTIAPDTLSSSKILSTHTGATNVFHATVEKSAQKWAVWAIHYRRGGRVCFLPPLFCPTNFSKKKPAAGEKILRSLFSKN